MGKFISNIIAPVCGIITALLTLSLVVAVNNQFSISLNTYSLWFVLPIGGFLTGAAAMSGVAFVFFYFPPQRNVRSGFWILLQVLIIAGSMPVLIYYAEYKMLVLDNGVKASTLVSFGRYLDVVLTKAHYEMHIMVKGVYIPHGVDMGEDGNVGYWRFGIQCIGFILGGLASLAYSLTLPFCKKCQKNLKVRETLTKRFSSSEDFARYYDNLFTFPMESAEFAAMLQNSGGNNGNIILSEALYDCPECKGKMIENKVNVFNGKTWNEVSKLTRRIPVPDGKNIQKSFQEAVNRTPHNRK